MSLAKLTSIATQSLSLLLERERLQTLPSFSSNSGSQAGSNPLHLPQLKRNLAQLRNGILDMESAEGGVTETTQLLRNQYSRMKGMLGVDGQDVESLDPPQPTKSEAPSPFEAPYTSPLIPQGESEPSFARYTDDPEGNYEEPGVIMENQRYMMEEQDGHLDRLSRSINRQRDISLQINDELDVHHGLLEELDTDVDQTGDRMSNARRRLDRFARGAKENGSTWTIGLLIFVLLILIIVFKT